MEKIFLSSSDIKNNENMAQLFKVLGHPCKLSIFKFLCNGGCKKMRVLEIYKSLGIKQTTASRHLSELKKSDILNRINENGNVYYQLNIGNELVECVSQCFIKQNK